MKISVQIADLLADYAGAVVLRLPHGWQKIAVYKEAAKDSDGDLRCIETVRCDINGEVVSDISMKAEEYIAFERLYNASINDGYSWSAMLFTVNCKGVFDTRFYYDGTPLLDGDHKIALERISEAFL